MISLDLHERDQDNVIPFRDRRETDQSNVIISGVRRGTDQDNVMTSGDLHEINLAFMTRYAATLGTKRKLVCHSPN